MQAIQEVNKVSETILKDKMRVIIIRMIETLYVCVFDFQRPPAPRAATLITSIVLCLSVYSPLASCSLNANKNVPLNLSLQMRRT